MPSIIRTTAVALKALRRNVLRSALTTLGIIIGVAAVIAMVQVGQGSAVAVKRTITRMGADILVVMPGALSSAGISTGSGSAITLTHEDAQAIERECPAVKAVAPVLRARTQVVYGNRNWVPYWIYGSTPDYLEVKSWLPVAEGESFTEVDVRNAAKVCLIGQTVARELFISGESPVGQMVRIQNVSLRVVGVLAPKGANMIGMDQDDTVIMPWTTLRTKVVGSQLADTNQSTPPLVDSLTKVNTLNTLYPGLPNQLYPIPSPYQAVDTPQPVRFSNVSNILVRTNSVEDIPAGIQQVRELLRERHRIGPGDPDDFTVRDMSEAQKALNSTARMMAGLLLIVALISLVVGGVGIMNIMLVSVTERTREIGLRMAVGARPRDILRQFLVESVLLCLMGGAVGIAAGWVSSYIVSQAMNWPFAPSLPAALAAVGVSVGVGVGFGYYPAWKASRLDPIEALRYD
jgi:ABC-type antimicrobial peptide transport system permease subunit